MADDEVTPLTMATANYGWTKPDVMGSDDAWGGMLNADLDGIDSIVHGIDTRPSYVLPIATTTVLGGVKVDGTTIHVAGDGTLSGTPSSGPPVTISDTAPVSPQVGALWWNSSATGSGGGQLYTWFNDGNSSQWVPTSNAAASLLPASTTVLGGVKVDGTTIQAAADGTISTTVVPLGDNRIINGDMRIDQRNNGASGTAISVYTIDRWLYGATQASKGSWQRQNGPSASGFPYALGFFSSSAYTPLAGDTFYFNQRVEADMISDFAWGTASAQPVTLSFWVALVGLAGTFSGSITNTAGNRSYPFSYSIPSAGAWTKIVITIPGDTAGTWVLSGNALALNVFFELGGGATLRAPAGAWTNGNFVGANGAASVVAVNGAQFYVTGVKLEIGSVATPYNRQSLAKSMADCQRYYTTGQLLMTGYISAAGANFQTMISTQTYMRTTPTATVAINNNANISGFVLNASVNAVWNSGTVTAIGNVTLNTTYTLSAEL